MMIAMNKVHLTLILDFINPAYDGLMSNKKNSELHISILDDYKI